MKYHFDPNTKNHHRDWEINNIKGQLLVFPCQHLARKRMKDLEIKQKPEESSQVLITLDKTSKAIVRDEKGWWIPGHTGNPGGRSKKSDWEKVIREHQDVLPLINEIFKATLDNNDSRQETDWRIGPGVIWAEEEDTGGSWMDS